MYTLYVESPKLFFFEFTFLYILTSRNEYSDFIIILRHVLRIYWIDISIKYTQDFNIILRGYKWYLTNVCKSFSWFINGGRVG